MYANLSSVVYGKKLVYRFAFQGGSLELDETNRVSYSDSGQNAHVALVSYN